MVGRQCPLATLRTVFNCFPEEVASGLGLGPAPGPGLGPASGNNNSYSDSYVKEVVSGMTEEALVPAAALVDRPRLSCGSLRHQAQAQATHLCDDLHLHSNDDNVDVNRDGHINDDDNGNSTTTTPAAAVGPVALGPVDVGQQLMRLVQQLRGRSRYKQVQLSRPFLFLPFPSLPFSTPIIMICNIYLLTHY